MDNRKLSAALIGGGVFGILTALPYIGGLCCVLYIGGGLLASYLYMRGAGPFERAPYGAASTVGLVSGVVGGVVATLGGLLLTAVGLLEDQRAEALAALAQAQQMGVPEEVVEFMRTILPLDGPTVGSVVTSLITNVVFFTVFAAVGGLLGAALFYKRNQDDG